MNSSSKYSAIIHVIVGAAALILVTQGISFARWNDFQNVSHKINDHATLFIISGLGLLALQVFVGRTSRQLSELKDRITQLEAR
jgi:glucose uptake protein GlcU